MRQAGTYKNTASRTGIIASLVLVIVVVVSQIMAPAVAAQTLTGTDFTTENGKHSVSWNESWEASITEEDDFSTMVMLESDIMIYAVMFVHDSALGLSPRSVYYSLADVLIGSFDGEPKETVEWEGDDGAFRGLNLVELSGIDFLIYLRVDPGTGESGPVMQFAAAPLRAFPSSLTAMQDEIVIDDLPVMSGDDSELVVAKLEESTADTATSDEAAEATPPGVSNEPAPAIAESDRQLPSSAPAPGSAGNEEAGGEYVSSKNGFTVNYGDGWAPTDTSIGEFSIESSGRPEVVLSFTGRSTTETNREAYFGDIVSREERHSGYINSVISDDRLLIASWSDSNELVVLEYVFVDDNTVVTAMATLSGSRPERGIDGVRTVQLNDESILRDWDQLWTD